MKFLVPWYIISPLIATFTLTLSVPCCPRCGLLFWCLIPYPNTDWHTDLLPLQSSLCCLLRSPFYIQLLPFFPSELSSYAKPFPKLFFYGAARKQMSSNEAVRWRWQFNYAFLKIHILINNNWMGQILIGYCSFMLRVSLWIVLEESCSECVLFAFFFLSTGSWYSFLGLLSEGKIC